VRVPLALARALAGVRIAPADRPCKDAVLVAARAVLRYAPTLRFVDAQRVLLAAQALARRRDRALVARADVDAQAPVRPADRHLRKRDQQQEAQRRQRCLRLPPLRCQHCGEKFVDTPHHGRVAGAAGGMAEGGRKTWAAAGSIHLKVRCARLRGVRCAWRACACVRVCVCVCVRVRVCI